MGLLGDVDNAALEDETDWLVQQQHLLPANGAVNEQDQASAAYGLLTAQALGLGAGSGSGGAGAGGGAGGGANGLTGGAGGAVAAGGWPGLGQGLGSGHLSAPALFASNGGGQLGGLARPAGAPAAVVAASSEEAGSSQQAGQRPPAAAVIGAAGNGNVTVIADLGDGRRRRMVAVRVNPGEAPGLQPPEAGAAQLVQPVPAGGAPQPGMGLEGGALQRTLSQMRLAQPQLPPAQQLLQPQSRQAAVPPALNQPGSSAWRAAGLPPQEQDEQPQQQQQQQQPQMVQRRLPSQQGQQATVPELGAARLGDPPAPLENPLGELLERGRSARSLFSAQPGQLGPVSSALLQPQLLQLLLQQQQEQALGQAQGRHQARQAQQQPHGQQTQRQGWMEQGPQGPAANSGQVRVNVLGQPLPLFHVNMGPAAPNAACEQAQQPPGAAMGLAPTPPQAGGDGAEVPFLDSDGGDGGSPGYGAMPSPVMDGVRNGDAPAGPGPGPGPAQRGTGATQAPGTANALAPTPQARVPPLALRQQQGQQLSGAPAQAPSQPTDRNSALRPLAGPLQAAPARQPPPPLPPPARPQQVQQQAVQQAAQQAAQRPKPPALPMGSVPPPSARASQQPQPQPQRPQQLRPPQQPTGPGRPSPGHRQPPQAPTPAQVQALQALQAIRAQAPAAMLAAGSSPVQSPVGRGPAAPATAAVPAAAAVASVAAAHASPVALAPAPARAAQAPLGAAPASTPTAARAAGGAASSALVLARVAPQGYQLPPPVPQLLPPPFPYPPALVAMEEGLASSEDDDDGAHADESYRSQRPPEPGDVFTGTVSSLFDTGCFVTIRLHGRVFRGMLYNTPWAHERAERQAERRRRRRQQGQQEQQEPGQQQQQVPRAVGDVAVARPQQGQPQPQGGAMPARALQHPDQLAPEQRQQRQQPIPHLQQQRQQQQEQHQDSLSCAQGQAQPQQQQEGEVEDWQQHVGWQGVEDAPEGGPDQQPYGSDAGGMDADGAGGQERRLDIGGSRTASVGDRLETEAEAPGVPGNGRTADTASDAPQAGDAAGGAGGNLLGTGTAGNLHAGEPLGPAATPLSAPQDPRPRPFSQQLQPLQVPVQAPLPLPQLQPQQALYGVAGSALRPAGGATQPEDDSGQPPPAKRQQLMHSQPAALEQAGGSTPAAAMADAGALGAAASSPAAALPNGPVSGLPNGVTLGLPNGPGPRLPTRRGPRLIVVAPAGPVRPRRPPPAAQHDPQGRDTGNRAAAATPPPPAGAPATGGTSGDLATADAGADIPDMAARVGGAHRPSWVANRRQPAVWPQPAAPRVQPARGAFIFFFADKQDGVQAAHPGVDAMELNRRVGGLARHRGRDGAGHAADDLRAA